MPEQELVNITINGVRLQVPKGEKIIESARRIGVEIPFFCYHPRLSMDEGGANCRMCLVEVGTTMPDGSVRKMPKPQTACSLPASEGLVIETDTEAIARDRRGVLEFLLINHPLDCPICDRGGECPLQNNTLYYGPPTSRYVEEKRHFPKAYPLSKYVVFDRERCIHCARCTRFTRDVSGDHQLDFLFRGADMEVATFQHTEFTSKFSGNVIEICPVGALLSRTYRFSARPWDLLTERSICTQCGNGCNIKIDHRDNRLLRVNARLNEAVNEEWTCDRGKFGMDYVSAPERLQQPLLKVEGAFRPISWAEADALLVERLQQAGRAVGGIGGCSTPNEDLFQWQRFFREVLHVPNLDHRMGPHFLPTNGGLYRRFGYHTMGNAIADMERMRAIFVFGASLADEQPILFLRVRKAWRFKGAQIIEAGTRKSEVSDFASVSLVHKPGAELALLNGLLRAVLDQQEGSGKPPVPEWLEPWTVGRAALECGVDEADLRRAAFLLASGEAALIAGHDVTTHPQAGGLLTALGNLAAATGNPGNVNVPVAQCNQQGAMDMGILPDVLPGYEPAAEAGLNTQQMLEAAASGDLKVLWIVGQDVVQQFHDKDLAARALEACPFVVVNELALTRTAEFADLVLPVQSVAERDGTFTNIERRVQRFYKCFEPVGEARPDWLIFSLLATRMGGMAPVYSFRDLLEEINRSVPCYQGCTLDAMGDEGIRWEYPPQNRTDVALEPPV
ncbi:MAG: NADH-quinone oxidoreductase subunit NuoG [Chthonomonadales bacterium]